MTSSISCEDQTLVAGNFGEKASFGNDCNAFLSFHFFLHFSVFPKNIKENEKRDDSKVGCVVAHVNITIQPGRVHKGLGRYPNSIGRWLVPFQLS
jgi:hypothetical protein